MEPTRASVVLFAACLASVAAAGCATPPERQRVTFNVNSAFDGPSQVSAGWTTIDLENDGTEPHNLQLVHLPENRTVEDLLAYTETHNGTFPAWADEAGGPNAGMPGATTSATTNLEPGRYAVLCIIPGPDGRMHALDGEATTITVTGDGGAAAPPTADTTIELVDFAFAFEETIGPGERTFEVTNAGSEPHELVLVRLIPNATLDDVLVALGPNGTGPPPATFLGGVTGIEAGDTQYFTATLEPGDYGLVCFLPGREDHVPHFAKGMRATFTVEG